MGDVPIVSDNTIHSFRCCCLSDLQNPV